MTPEELLAEIERGNRETLALLGFESSEVMLELAMRLTMRGCDLGAAWAISRMESTMVLYMARIGK